MLPKCPGLNARRRFPTRLQKQIKHLGLLLLLAVVGLVMLPAARHRIVERGQDTPGMLLFTKWCLRLALLPLALAIGIDLFTAGAQVGGNRVGAAISGGAVLLSIALWYGIVVLREPREKEEEDVKETPLEEKIVQVLTEARVVFPGAQALLGFQLAMMMMESFEKLPQSSKIVHLVSLCFIAATTILLIAPAAFHRLVERGEDTERFHSFASAMVVLAMITLAPGFCLDPLRSDEEVDRVEQHVGSGGRSSARLLLRRVVRADALRASKEAHGRLSIVCGEASRVLRLTDSLPARALQE